MEQKGGCRSERIPIPPESPVVRSVEHLQNLYSERAPGEKKNSPCLDAGTYRYENSHKIEIGNSLTFGWKGEVKLC